MATTLLVGSKNQEAKFGEPEDLNEIAQPTKGVNADRCRMHFFKARTEGTAVSNSEASPRRRLITPAVEPVKKGKNIDKIRAVRAVLL